jgi:hypothetical protein
MEDAMIRLPFKSKHLQQAPTVFLAVLLACLFISLSSSFTGSRVSLDSQLQQGSANAGRAQAPSSTTNLSGLAAGQADENTLVADPGYSDPGMAELFKLINETPLKKMDLEFFKKVYKFEHAPEKLKLIFGITDGPFPDKNRRLGNLRKWYDWNVQGEFARDSFCRVENTNQGKDNGARSDFDATANILSFDAESGKWNLKDKAVRELITFQEQRYNQDGLSPEMVDVTLFNGEIWMPDWRDSRMSYQDFWHSLVTTVHKLKEKKGAYYVPGAHKEQAHDRALAEGHSVQIGWNYHYNNGPGKPSGRLTINGIPVDFDLASGEIVDVTTRQPIKEYVTREAARKGILRRYEGTESLEPHDAWRRSLGNLVQNAKEFLSHEEVIARNKYFIERVIDSGVGRFTHLADSINFDSPDINTGGDATYVQIHGSNLPEAQKSDWKRAFIQQGFGIPVGDTARIAYIQRILDVSSDIQLDKTGKRFNKVKNDYVKVAQNPDGYYAAEWQAAGEAIQSRIARMEAERNQKLSSKEILELRVREAERLFAEKQRGLILEGGVRIVEEAFNREFTADGLQRNRGNRFTPETAKRIMAERATELALLFDVIETSPGLKASERDALKRRYTNAVPEKARPLVGKMAQLSALKLMLVGGVGFEQWTKAKDGLSDIRPTDLLVQVDQELRKLVGDIDTAPPPGSILDEVRVAFLDTIMQNLGPVEGAEFKKAWDEGKRALMTKIAGKEYWKAVVDGADFLTLSSAGLALVGTYQAKCANKDTWTEDCLTGLAGESGNQILGMLPGINTGMQIFQGLREIGEGNSDGFTTLALGTVTLPSLARIGVIAGAAKVYLVCQLLRAGSAVTYGYVTQIMENDQLEQAFKSIPEPGQRARPYQYPGRTRSFKMDTPNKPILAEIFKVPADDWDDSERMQIALLNSAAAIQAELAEQDLKPDTDAGRKKMQEIARAYANALPYQQRMQKVYEYFSPLIEAQEQKKSSWNRNPGERGLYMASCLDVSDAEIEEKYKLGPSLTDRLRFWRDEAKDKQRDQALAWSDCVKRAVDVDADLLEPVFDEYVDKWFAAQDSVYRESYDSPEFREKLRAALMREYVMRRHLDSGEEEKRQMKNAMRIAVDFAETRKLYMAQILNAAKNTQDQLQKALEEAVALNYQSDPPAVLSDKPEITLKIPYYMPRLDDVVQIEVSARGQYYPNDKSDGPARNMWKATLTSEFQGASEATKSSLTNVSPKYDVDKELKVEPGKPPKRLFKFTEKITGELKDGTDKVLATGEVLVDYFDILNFDGNIGVNVLAEGPKDASGNPTTSPYDKSQVKLSGPVQRQKEYRVRGGLNFESLPAGKYVVHAEPRAGDMLHRAAQVNVELTDFSPVPANEDIPEAEQDNWMRKNVSLYHSPMEEGTPIAVLRWKPNESATVILPFVEPKKPVDSSAQQQKKPPAEARAPDSSRAEARDSSQAGALVSQAQADLSGLRQQREALAESCQAIQGEAAAIEQLIQDAAAGKASLTTAAAELATVAKGCNEAISLRSEIDGLVTRAVDNQRRIAGELPGAASKATQCSSKEDAASIRETYSNCQGLAAELEQYVSTAKTKNERILSIKAQVATDISEILASAATQRAKIGQDVAQIRQLADSLAGNLKNYKDAQAQFAAQKAAILQQLAVLNGMLASEPQSGQAGASIRASIAAITAALNALSDPGECSLPDVPAKRAEAERLLAETEILSSRLVDPSAGCRSLLPADEAIQKIEAAVSVANTALAENRDLPSKAAECDARFSSQKPPPLFRASKINTDSTDNTKPAEATPPLFKASKTARQDKIVAAILSIIDDSVPRIYENIRYQYLQTQSSVVAHVRYTDRTEEIIDGTKAFTECLSKGYYQQISGLGYVRTGMAYAVGNSTASQQAGSRDKEEEAAAGGQPPGTPDTGGEEPGTGKGKAKTTGDGNSLLGVEFISKLPSRDADTDLKLRYLGTEFNETISALRTRAGQDLDNCLQAEEQVFTRCRNACEADNKKDGTDRDCLFVCYPESKRMRDECLDTHSKKSKEIDSLIIARYEIALQNEAEQERRKKSSQPSK